MRKPKINYNDTFGTMHSRDYYRGASFHFSGKWVSGAHYISDDYNVDFVVHGQTLLACAKSHLSTLENEPTEFITDESGTAIGVISTYWDFVLSGIVGDSPGIKIIDNYWYICKNTNVPEEEQVWENTGVKAKMELSDLSPEEIALLQEPGKQVVAEFVNNTITQETGQNVDKIMSQKAVTDALNTKATVSQVTSAITNEVQRADLTYQPKGDYATNTTVSANKTDADNKITAVNERIDTTNANVATNAETIQNEIENRESEIERIEGLLSAEETARVESDNALSNRISQEATDRSTADNNFEQSIVNINSKIPSAASSSNQLADKAFVNSSIATSTANFRGTSATGLTEAQFLTWANDLTHDENDYVYWNTVDLVGNVVFKRYKYSGNSWVYEYDLNNSSFTADEWAAIQSGITSDLVTKLTALPTNADLTTALNNKVDKVIGKQLSTEDYTTGEKQKLAGIASGAEVNVQSDWNVTDTNSDAFIKNKPENLVQDASYVHTDNNYTTAEKNKLSGIATSAQVNVLEGVQVNGTDLTITNKKVNVTVPTKTSQLTNDDNVVKDASYVHTDNNYTSTEKSKLSGIEESAQVNKIEHITLSGTEQTITNKTVNLPAYPTTLPASDVYEWAKASTKPSYNLSEIGNADDVKAIENLSGTSGFLKKTAANSWSLDTNTYITARDLGEADLLTRINTLAYGIQWSKNSSTCTRIGNPLLHRTLPIQSQMKGCVEKNGEPVYWLDPSNWAYKANGDPSVLDGTDGYVRDYIPRFYGRSWDTEDYSRVMISTVKIDDTWVEIPEHFEDAYESALDRTNLKLCSVVNTSAQYRGGTNSSTYDSYEAMRSLLGKPATNFSRANARTYASNAGSELLGYNIYKWIFLWLPVIEYANFDLQTAINNNLTAEGYHQGGLGNGATTFSPWGAYNGYNPIIPCGLTNSLGNFSGQVGIDYSAFDSYSAGTVYANRYRGLECPFGDVWTNLDGIIVDANHSDYDLVYTCNDPSKYSDSITSAYINTSRSIHTDGYVKEFDLGNTGEITAISVGGGKADYHYTGSINSTLRTVQAGGTANNGSAAGPGYLYSNNGVSYSDAYIGFRTIKRIY